VSTRNAHARGALSYLALLVEVSTTTDTSVSWTAAPGFGGNGDVILNGGGTSPVTVTFDLDLTPNNPGAPVDVKGTMRCPAPTG
jgi:hypothetical protein